MPEPTTPTDSSGSTEYRIVKITVSVITAAFTFGIVLGWVDAERASYYMQELQDLIPELVKLVMVYVTGRSLPKAAASLTGGNVR